MSRHRRQPSRSLPLDFSVDGGDDEPVAAKGTTPHVDGAPRGGRATDAGAAKQQQDGQGNKKPPPPAAPGGRASSDGAGKKSCDDHTADAR
ncbi:hypothetical protein GUJ93_ZPchr0001g32373 [Zizania palustris]|uniref:Uncharacterized protein n=1 Tax=Zizania palustris TaxID=103762 RepID=A0A8J5RT91_ZIZPA|nr:hypothetical protein GUJ93_ZPchr0001g32373 [Zizania palustris]